MGRTDKNAQGLALSVHGARPFVHQGNPNAAGIIVAGREHFFDNDRELTASLGTGNSFVRLLLSEFTQEQVVAYLRKRGWQEAVPDWLPSRPLLLGYLASRQLLQQTLEIDAGSSPAKGWHVLLTRISEREAEIEAGIDADTVRRLIEHLATTARKSADGLGPLLPHEITAAFLTTCGYAPDDRGAVLLQRLPGLGGHSSEDGARVFVDRDLAAAASAGGVFQYAENPFGVSIEPADWLSVLQPLGVEVLALRLLDARFTPAKLSAAVHKASEIGSADTLAADLLLGMQQLGLEYTASKTYVREAIIPRLSYDAGIGDMSAVEWQDCLVARLELSPEVEEAHLPTFTRCFFSVVDGRTSIAELPAQRFIDPVVEEFEDHASTTNALLQLSLPLGTKVLLTVLKKLYAQRGNGRRESALFRGLDHRAREAVPSVLALLRREGFTTRTRLGEYTVWLPARGSDIQQRVARILSGPTSCDDALIRQSADLG